MNTRKPLVLSRITQVKTIHMGINGWSYLPSTLAVFLFPIPKKVRERT